MTSPTLALTPSEIEGIKAQAATKFVTALEQAIENVIAISGMTVPEIREVAAGREGTLKAIKIGADPTALQANLAIIDRALGRPTERMEGARITVPIQIVMGSEKVVDVTVTPVQPVTIA